MRQTRPNQNLTLSLRARLARPLARYSHFLLSVVLVVHSLPPSDTLHTESNHQTNLLSTLLVTNYRVLSLPCSLFMHSFSTLNSELCSLCTNTDTFVDRSHRQTSAANVNETKTVADMICLVPSLRQHWKTETVNASHYDGRWTLELEKCWGGSVKRWTSRKREEVHEHSFENRLAFEIGSSDCRSEHRFRLVSSRWIACTSERIISTIGKHDRKFPLFLLNLCIELRFLGNQRINTMCHTRVRVSSGRSVSKSSRSYDHNDQKHIFQL